MFFMRIRSFLIGPVFAVLVMVLPCMAEVNEVDSNFDGKIDQWQYVNAQGKIEKIEYDGDFEARWTRLSILKVKKSSSMLSSTVLRMGIWISCNITQTAENSPEWKNQASLTAPLTGRNFSTRTGS